MSSKSFLIQECENVRNLLETTLRRDYGTVDGVQFFEECRGRLQFIIQELDQTDVSDHSGLTRSGRALNDLAGLICRIERSSIGEYSWPFVEELKTIATAICREDTLNDHNAAPQIYVFADGGLASYAIYTERNRPSFSRKRLLTIVFPKSLKHFVLLHPILGHELGHAIWQLSKHRAEIQANVLSHIKRTGGPLEKPEATAAVIYAKSAPTEFKAQLAKTPQLNQNNLFAYIDWEAWIEEILCDLIGLITFGPSFVAAHIQLLLTVDPSGLVLGPKHPFAAWRVNMMLAGAAILKFDRVPSHPGNLRDTVLKFWEYVGTFKKADTWYDLIPTAQLADMLAALKGILDRFPPSSYVVPSHGRVEHLLNSLVALVPPTGNRWTRNSTPLNVPVDFRHILYAGWLASQHYSNIPFKRINQLCELGILQQRAIQIQLEVKP